MAQVQIGRGRIHPELDSQRTAFAKFGRQLGGRNHFGGVASQLLGLLFGFLLFQCSLRYAPARFAGVKPTQ